MEQNTSETYFLGKVPTCVWIEPARSDCVSGLSRSLPKSRQNVLEIRHDFKAHFLSKKVPKVSKMDSQMGSKMAPKLSKREAFLENCSGGVLGSHLGAFWDALGSLLDGFWEHFGEMLE